MTTIELNNGKSSIALADNTEMKDIKVNTISDDASIITNTKAGLSYLVSSTEQGTEIVNITDYREEFLKAIEKDKSELELSGTIWKKGDSGTEKEETTLKVKDNVIRDILDKFFNERNPNPTTENEEQREVEEAPVVEEDTQVQPPQIEEQQRILDLTSTDEIYSSIKDNSVALTLDDGPDPLYTKEVLDLLDQEGVKATFFIVGDFAEKNPEIVREIYNRGHEIGIHTQNHPNFDAEGLYEGRTEEEVRNIVRSEIEESMNSIRKAVGEDIEFQWFRAPYGALGRNFGSGKTVVEEVANELGLSVVGWTVDTQDWDKRMSSQDMLDQIEQQQNIVSGDIVLFHDGRDAILRMKEDEDPSNDDIYYSHQPNPNVATDKTNTIEALRTYIRELKEKNVEIGSLSDSIE